MPPGAQGGGFDEEPLSGRSVENARFGTQPPFSTQATSFNRKRVSISSFQPDYGNKFLTYAAPAIHNAMLDYIRRLNPTFEAKNLDCIIRLDEVKKGENKGQHEFIADSRVQNPEQIFIAKETHEEIHTALEMIDEREKAYLWYRFGFEDDVLHPLSETAKHFHLSESRAKSTEKLALDNFWLELPWWY